MFNRTEEELIADMLISRERILKYTQGISYEKFCDDTLIQDAIVRNIEILGEATKRISETFKNKYSQIEWKEISKTRDKIIHFYFGIDLSIVWDIVTINIPDLYKKLRQIHRMENWELPQ